jgi:pimeloyl-ACP methyl ester carboxylesterase
MGPRHSGADQARFTDAGDVRLAYNLSGGGEPPLVFVHGWSCDRTYFEPQFRHFAARHAVAALDRADTVRAALRPGTGRRRSPRMCSLSPPMRA